MFSDALGLMPVQFDLKFSGDLRCSGMPLREMLRLIRCVRPLRMQSNLLNLFSRGNVDVEFTFAFAWDDFCPTGFLHRRIT